MSEILLILIAALDLAFVLWMHHLGKEWLYASIVINLVLISIFGAKLISIFGFVTNSGNVFYASAFFATYLLVEHYGMRQGLKAVFMGVIFTPFFIVMSNLTANIAGMEQTGMINGSMHTLFTLVPRVALASLVAYVVAQSFNVLIYATLKERDGKKFLWRRSLVSVLGAQFLDSIIFFSIAFLGIVPLSVIAQAMIVGFAVKAIVGITSTPLLYLSYKIKSE